MTLVPFLQIRYLPLPVNCESFCQVWSQAVVENGLFSSVMSLFSWSRDIHENVMLALVGFSVVLQSI